LKDSGHLHAKPTVAPLPVHCKLKPDEGVPLEDPTLYRTFIGKLNFLSHTRPDISDLELIYANSHFFSYGSPASALEVHFWNLWVGHSAPWF